MSDKNPFQHYEPEDKGAAVAERINAMGPSEFLLFSTALAAKLTNQRRTELHTELTQASITQE